MFEEKTPSPGAAQPHPLDVSLESTGALPESQPFFDPFAPQWDDEVNQRIRPRPKGSVPPFKSMYKNMPSIYEMTMPGMISKIDLNKVPGLLRIRDRDKPKEKLKTAPPAASHTTVPGDTLAALALKYKVSEDALREANADKVKKFKRNNGQGHLEGFDIGVELAIPSGEAIPVKTTTAPVADTQPAMETKAEKGGMASTE
ncbi:LysM peptidoglycan-binding domain-containing protein, partial [Fulvivirga kasyanovii]